MERWAKIRLWVDGRVVDQVTVLGDEEVDQSGSRHGELADAAEDRGLTWMVEIEFPDGEHVRWGTDSRAMVDPVPAEPDMVEQLARARGWRR